MCGCSTEAAAALPSPAFCHRCRPQQPRHRHSPRQLQPAPAEVACQLHPAGICGILGVACRQALPRNRAHLRSTAGQGGGAGRGNWAAWGRRGGDHPCIASADRRSGRAAVPKQQQPAPTQKAAAGAAATAAVATAAAAAVAVAAAAPRQQQHRQHAAPKQHSSSSSSGTRLGEVRGHDGAEAAAHDLQGGMARASNHPMHDKRAPLRSSSSLCSKQAHACSGELQPRVLVVNIAERGAMS